jgi:hypothetical protein
MKKEAVSASERVGSREAVERAIEKSKEGSTTVWDRRGPIPKWGEKRREPAPAAASEKRP